MVITIALLLSNVFVFVLTSTGNLSLYDLGIIPSFVTNGEVYRLFTSIFVHAGILHLVCNMASLLYCGQRLERRIGHVKMLVSYLACGLGGSVAVLLFSNSYTVTVGASGAIFGMMGMLLIIMLKTHDSDGFIAIGLNVVTNLYVTFTTPSISVGAHAGGLICGVVLGVLISTKQNKREDRFELIIPDKPGEKRKEKKSPMAWLFVVAFVLLMAAVIYKTVSDKEESSGVGVRLPMLTSVPDISTITKISPRRIPQTK